MPPPPLTVSLTKYAHIEIVRAEMVRVGNDLKEIEVRIKDILLEQERQRFLQTVHSFFRQMPAPKGAQELPELNAKRNQLHDALQALQAALTALEAETSAAAAHPQPAGSSSTRQAVHSPGASATRPAVQSPGASATRPAAPGPSAFTPRPAAPSPTPSAGNPAVPPPPASKRPRFDSFDDFRTGQQGGAK